MNRNASEHNWPSSSLNEWLVLGLYTALISLVVIASFELGITEQNLVLLWPTAGFCTWVAMRYGWKSAPVVFFAHQSHSWFIVGDSNGMYLAMNIANAIGYGLAYMAYKRYGGTEAVFDSVRSTILFVFAFAVGMSTFTGILGSYSFVYFLDLPSATYGSLVWRWILSDFSGVILFAPPLIALLQATNANNLIRVRDLILEIRTTLLIGAAVICAVALLAYLIPSGHGKFPIVLLIMPLCIWLALNDRPRSSMVLLSITIISTLGLMLWAEGAASGAAVYAVQPFVVMLMLTCLVIRASNTERSTALNSLRIEREQLEIKVDERTLELKTLAETDVLTGLFNRRSFEQELERLYEQSSGGDKSSYLLCLDLDQFKIINDTSGHAAGDAVLRRVAESLTENLRKTDIIGRLGGDEFAALLPNCPSNSARCIAEKIRMDIDALRVRWERETHQVGVSIGAALIDPARGSVDDIMQLADAACYAAKNGGRNRVHMAEAADSVVAELRGNIRWAHRINDAIENDHFLLFGQRIQSFKNDDQREHIEIFLRLKDLETNELIPPGAFLPAAERYGLAVRIDEWVVNELIRTLRERDQLQSSEHRYWVNLSGASVGDEKFVDFLIEAIDDSSIAPGLINFEITETAVIRNINEAQRMMKQLHELGCQFALDDFGTGLSSFSHLKQLPVDHLKIDGMFVRSVTTDSIDNIFVKSIIDIAHTMGIKAVVEFVENEDILAQVSAMGADFGQGFGIHRPEPLSGYFEDIKVDHSNAKAF